MKITADTTLGELFAERERLGITNIQIKIAKGNRIVTVEASDGSGRQVSGPSECEALSKAFEHYTALSAVPK